MASQGGPSRRDFVKRVGVAAGAAPAPGPAGATEATGSSGDAPKKKITLFPQTELFVKI